MIIDSHCHAWRSWPYQPPVPDPTSRGAIEQLLFELDQHGVDRAVLVAARIDHNPDNNDYVAACVRRFPDRLEQFADVDCMWTGTYHTPGAADRLAAAVRAYRLKGFTHYVRDEDDGSWFLSDEGLRFLRTAAELNQVVSVSWPPHLQPVLREVARRFPSVPFLCHHMGFPRAAEGPDGPRLRAVLASAAVPNIHVKLSGFHYVGPVAWEYPYPECAFVVRALYERFGPERLHWGSDYPVVRQAMTYRQALEAVRTHCDFIPPADLGRILGDSLGDLLERHGAA
jgi:predicted TIM-barrel fold metal-dependent hydrolase